MYVYIPYRDQNQLPVFDTSIPDLNLIELFRPNRFVGIDRIGDANQLTVGLTTRCSRTRAAARYLSATIGQSVYFEPPRVTLPQPALSLPPSALTLQQQQQITPATSWSSRHHLEPDRRGQPDRLPPLEPAIGCGLQPGRLERRSRPRCWLQYLANSKQVVNVGYLFREG